ncbi:MAG TPA: SsrA-binding protein SmpB [Gemmatimonadota bacterium]|nr:SsrA-binding protein SmpB [Gemmatimonadota bacterium]
MAEPRTVTVNRKARHDYFIEETVEAGMVLSGSEVKSLRAGHANLKDSFVRVARGEATLLNAHISPYDPASRDNQDPTRGRKLLLHRREIDRLGGKVNEKGLTLIALRVYFNARGRAKVELGLARGKRQYDKRQTIKEREARREAARAMRSAGGQRRRGG